MVLACMAADSKFSYLYLTCEAVIKFCFLRSRTSSTLFPTLASGNNA